NIPIIHRRLGKVDLHILPCRKSFLQIHHCILDSRNLPLESIHPLSELSLLGKLLKKILILRLNHKKRMVLIYLPATWKERLSLNHPHTYEPHGCEWYEKFCYFSCTYPLLKKSVRLHFIPVDIFGPRLNKYIRKNS